MSKGKKRGLLKIAVDWPSFPQQVHEMAQGVSRFARISGKFQLCEIPYVDHREIPKWIARLRPDGLLLWLAAVDFQEIRCELPAGLPMVNIGADRLGPDIGGIRSSDEGIVGLLHQHLSEAGYEHIALVVHGHSATMLKRLELLRGRAGDVESFDLSSLEYDEACEAQSNRDLERWLRGLRRPVGIVANHGYYARCISLACRQARLAVPREVGILSVYDDRLCIFSDPPISAVRVDAEGMGYAAMKLLAAQLRGRKAPAEMIQVEPLDVIARGSAEREKPHTEHIAAAVEYIEQNACEGIGVDDVLRTTQTISRAKFYLDFAAGMGCSPADYIRRIKIARAKELLGTTTLSIKRIAPACGFQSVQQFYDAFTRAAGATPAAYRKRHARKGNAQR
jgi:LacI family transcriptional regulator